MGQQRRFNRKWATRNYVSNGTEIIDLPIGLDLESVLLYLSGTITLSTGATACLTEGIAKLLKRVELMIDGRTVASLPGTMLTHGNIDREGGLIKVNPGITVAAHDCEVVGFLDLSLLPGVRYKDCSLRTMGARQLQLRITWGALSDVYTGAFVSSGNTLQLGVTVRECREEPGSKLPEVLHHHKFFEKSYAASTVDRIPLDPNVLYRGLLIRCETVGDLSAAVLNNVKVQVGTDVLFDVPKAEIIDMNTQDYGFALPVGYYFIDFAPSPRGLVRMLDFLDLYGHADAFLILDVVGAATTKVQIMAHEFEWIDAAMEYNAAIAA